MEGDQATLFEQKRAEWYHKREELGAFMKSRAAKLYFEGASDLAKLDRSKIGKRDLRRVELLIDGRLLYNVGMTQEEIREDVEPTRFTEEHGAGENLIGRPMIGRQSVYGPAGKNMDFFVSLIDMFIETVKQEIEKDMKEYADYQPAKNAQAA